MEDSIRRELEVEVCTKLDAEKAFKKEEERLLKALNEKEQTVLVMSMEEDLISTVNSYFSEITEIQIETSAILETLNNVEHQRKLEIEEKNKSCQEETEQVVEARVTVELHVSAKKNANNTFLLRD
ncbi:hypothetical protein EZV62_019277 [Acer yangbiense]|uniref:Uncharacterized protein n=1 Tax=Acer yangbiense TaxID=1000413 RepID=A0A5C7HAR4_9ROSI|nr:hypothetical protein EZV62_019277 [Acer yangbiense]